MSNSVIMFMEGRGLGYVAAGLSGLGGVYTGGSIAGHYQSKKQEAAQRELDRRAGKLDIYKSDSTGRHMVSGLMGSLPVVGSLTNIYKASERYALEDKLREQDGKKKS
jgi:hypothetical protein